MGDEIEFINSRGEKTYLPESVGDSMGLQRASDFVPPESKVKDLRTVLSEAGFKVPEEVANGSMDSVDYVRSLRGGTLYDGSGGDGKPTFGQAVGLLREFMDTATDEEKQPERMDELANLGTDLMRYTGNLNVIEGQDEKTGAPSLVEAIAAVEVQIDADNSKTPAQKKTLKKHLQELLDAAPGDSTPPADTPSAE